MRAPPYPGREAFTINVGPYRLESYGAGDEEPGGPDPDREGDRR